MKNLEKKQEARRGEGREKITGLKTLAFSASSETYVTLTHAQWKNGDRKAERKQKCRS